MDATKTNVSTPKAISILESPEHSADAQPSGQGSPEKGFQATAADNAGGAVQGQPVSQETLNAEKKAQESHAQAQKVTDDADAVSVKVGTASADAVGGVVAAAQDDANAKGALADQKWDEEALRGGATYQQLASSDSLFGIKPAELKGYLSGWERKLSSGVLLSDYDMQRYQFVRDLANGKVPFGQPQATGKQPNAPVTPAQANASPTGQDASAAQDIKDWDGNADYRVGDRVKYGDTVQELVTNEDGSATEWKVIKDGTENGKREKNPKPVGYTDPDSEDGQTPSFTPSYVDADGRSVYEVVAKDGIVKTKDKNGKEHIEFRQVNFTPKNSADAYSSAQSGLSKEYEAEVEKARQRKDESLQTMLDSTSSMGDKAAAIERMAAADEIIRRYTDPSYVRGMRARKVLGMISDALAAIGNIITASKGGTAMKTTSATAQIDAKEKANETALQKRIDYWTNKMNSARSSDMKSASLLQSRGITAILKDFDSAERLARNKYTAKSAALKSNYDVQKEIDKSSIDYVKKWNYEVWKWIEQKDKQAFQWLLEHYRQGESNKRAEARNSVTKSEGAANRANRLEVADKRAGAGSIF